MIKNKATEIMHSACSDLYSIYLEGRHKMLEEEWRWEDVASSVIPSEVPKMLEVYMPYAR